MIIYYWLINKQYNEINIKQLLKVHLIVIIISTVHIRILYVWTLEYNEILSIQVFVIWKLLAITVLANLCREFLLWVYNNLSKIITVLVLLIYINWRIIAITIILLIIKRWLDYNILFWLWLNYKASILVVDNRIKKIISIWIKECETKPSDKIIYWLIGIIEGSLFKKECKSLQSVKLSKVWSKQDVEIFEIISKLFGIGKVQSSSGTVSWVVKKLDIIVLLFTIINGNIVGQHRLNRLDILVELLNAILVIRGKKPLVCLWNTALKLSWNNAWFAGLLNAKGCFNAQVVKGRLRLSIVITETNGRDLLSKISKTLYKNKHTAIVTISRNINEVQLKIYGTVNLEITLDYLSINPFFGSKNESMKKFKHLLILSKKLDPSKNVELFTKLASEINNN